MKRHAWAVALISMALLPGLAKAASVTPEHLEGSSNQGKTCSENQSAGQTWSELKVEGGSNFNGTHTDGILTVQISNHTTSPHRFDWSSNIGVDAVIVKNGQDGANLYRYDPPQESKGDTDLRTPNNGDKGISHISFCYDPPVGVDLAVSKTAVPSFTRTHEWDIAKDAAEPKQVTVSNGSATFNYTVVVTKSTQESDFAVSGAITVTNPNEDDATGVTVDDDIDGQACTVTPPAGFAGTIPAGTSAVFGYSCSYATPQSGTGTNTATVGWDQSSVDSPSDSATATADFDWADAVVTVHGFDTVDVEDSLAGPLGQTSSSQTYNYSLTHPAPANGCSSYTNVATIVQTQQSDDETVTVCKAVEGGKTIGYWQNRNGQRDLTINNAAQRAVLCDKLAAYGNILFDFNNMTCKTSPTYLPNYAKAVMSVATCAGDCATMLRAQFLATLFSAHFTPSLGTATVAVPGSILGTSDCITVNALLAAANQKYPGILISKSDTTAVKDLFDAINNNAAATC